MRLKGITKEIKDINETISNDEKLIRVRNELILLAITGLLILGAVAIWLGLSV